MGANVGVHGADRDVLNDGGDVDFHLLAVMSLLLLVQDTYLFYCCRDRAEATRQLSAS